MGTVGIYSDLQPYTFVVENYENGILADNNDSWCKAAEYLIDNPEERKRILENAEKTFDERFTSEKIAAELVSEFPELCEFSAPDITGEKVRINHLQLNFYKLCCIINTIVFKDKNLSIKGNSSHFSFNFACNLCVL